MLPDTLLLDNIIRNTSSRNDGFNGICHDDVMPLIIWCCLYSVIFIGSCKPGGTGHEFS